MESNVMDLKLGEETLRLRWDMGAMATFEMLTGQNALVGIPVNVSNVVALCWAAYDADYAARDETPPISYRRFASLLDTDEKQAAALKAASQLLGLDKPTTKAQASPDPQPAPTARRSPSRASTRSERSTSDSASASSGA